MSLRTEHCRLITLSLAIAIVVVSRPVNAQLAPPTGPSYGGSVPSSRKVVSGIAWYGVLKAAAPPAAANAELITARREIG